MKKKAGEPQYRVRCCLRLQTSSNQQTTNDTQYASIKSSELEQVKASLPSVLTGAPNALCIDEVDQHRTSQQYLFSGTKAKAKPKAKGAAGIGDGLTALATKHASYDPLKAATWKPGERVPFLFLAQALDSESHTPCLGSTAAQSLSD